MDGSDGKGVEDAPRIPTGTHGLDHILAGGLPPGRLYLLEGTPGSGKTTLALRFLLEGSEAGERGLYITVSETEDELRNDARSHGRDLDALDLFELVAADGFGTDQEQSPPHPGEIELGGTVRGVIERVEADKPRRVVIDSLSELRLLARNPLRYRRQILALKQFFSRLDCTVPLLDDCTSAPGDLRLHSIAHGIMTLEHTAGEFGAERRRLRVVRFRGVRYRGGWHDFIIERGGTGLEAPDPQPGQGLARGTNALRTGPAGVSKTTTAVRCMIAGLERGEKAAYFLFDERPGTLMMRSRSLGMDLQPHIDAGRLSIRQIEPAELSPGEFAGAVRHAVEVDGVTLVVIDSLNACPHAMPSDNFLLLQMHELLSYLSQQGIVPLMILGQHGVVGELRSDVDVTYLADTLLLLRFFESEGDVRKSIAVVKTRTAGHERTIREFGIDAGGIRVGDPIAAFSGILSGKPRYTAGAGALGGTRGDGRA